jgi:multidrug resistance efflux pump
MRTSRPIPTPWPQRLRELRIQAAPVIVFACALVAIAYFWRATATPVSFQGEVQALTSQVTAPCAGTLETVLVEPFQRVDEGDLVAWISVLPAERLQAALAVLQAEIELSRRGGFAPALDQQRNLINWLNMHQDLLQARATLASLRVRKAHARRDADRLRQLADQQHVAFTEYDRVQSIHDALAAEEAGYVALVDSLTTDLERSKPPSADGDGTAAALRAELDWQEKRLRQLEADMAPVALRAPQAGLVSMIHPDGSRQFRGAGEFVREGDVLFTIRANRAEFIVGYLREPIAVEPRQGMRVEVALRGGRRTRAEAHIIEVGAQFEAVQPAFQRTVLAREERALPLLISLPPELPLRPGELVDLRLLAQPRL